MNILMLQGGARKKGNTAHVLALVEEALQKKGHQVNTTYLHGKNLNGCLGCGACKKKPNEIGCVQKDDVWPHSARNADKRCHCLFLAALLLGRQCPAQGGY